MARENVKFLAKVYGRDGSTLKLNIPHSAIRTLPKYTDRINGGQGQCDIEYVTAFDDFGDGVTLDYEFILDLWVFDDDHPTGRRVFRGAIEDLTPFIKGAQQGVTISALGLGTKLAYDMHMASSRTVYTVSYNATDPEDIFKAIIDEWRGYVNNALIDYGVGSTDTVGTNVDKEFVDKTWFDACEETRELCPDGWWWHIDANGLASLLPKPSSATHSFIIGKHIQDGKFLRSVKSVKNRVRVTRNGGTVTEYSDATSISKYESRFDTIDDDSLGDVNAADQAGNKRVGDNKDPKDKNTLTINSTYDLESIKIGQTCKILNVDESATFVTNALIVGLSYNGDTMELELEESAVDLGLALDRLKRAS